MAWSTETKLRAEAQPRSRANNFIDETNAPVGDYPHDQANGWQTITIGIFFRFNVSKRGRIAIGLGLLAVAIGLRFAGVARPVLTLLHLASLAAYGIALVVRGTPTPKQ